MVLLKDSIKVSLDKCIQVMKKYEWLLELYVLDFFVDDHWGKLPLAWQFAFKNMDPQDLGDILTRKQTKHVLPLTFLSLLKSVESLSLPRKSEKLWTENLDSSKFKHLFLKHVKLKKRHEIGLMSNVVSKVAYQYSCSTVVDFGSGLGHLVRILSYKHKIDAIGIEAQSQLSEEARKLDLEWEYTAKKQLSEEEISNLHKPKHVNFTLSSTNQLDILINDTSYGLIGLHPCGDLGPLLIKHFVSCEKVKFICVVGCCYMKLSCDTECCGYPMSEYVKQKDSSLSYTVREISCHAIDMYCERLCKGDYNDLKIHAYRAALEKLLVNTDPKLKHTPVRSIKHSNDMTFESYLVKATERLTVPVLDSALVAKDLEQWRRVVVLYTLRLMLAPLVETIILLDRMLYIFENGLSCEIHPVFDPRISPRNHIIIGKRL
ncbi:protein RRNAD1 [Aricia agestis]|uniref:protein RRNAD1 n=1 Tax=Aricia agestis TaxID=91739 RepID=UPI001C207100|nr:protein RRNAD1 [Aricia agestis]